MKTQSTLVRILATLSYLGKSVGDFAGSETGSGLGERANGEGEEV